MCVHSSSKGLCCCPPASTEVVCCLLLRQHLNSLSTQNLNSDQGRAESIETAPDPLDTLRSSGCFLTPPQDLSSLLSRKPTNHLRTTSWRDKSTFLLIQSQEFPIGLEAIHWYAFVLPGVLPVVLQGPEGDASLPLQLQHHCIKSHCCAFQVPTCLHSLVGLKEADNASHGTDTNSDTGDLRQKPGEFKGCQTVNSYVLSFAYFLNLFVICYNTNKQLLFSFANGIRSSLVWKVCVWQVCKRQPCKNSELQESHMIQAMRGINHQFTEEKHVLCFIYESPTIFSSLLTYSSDSYQAKTPRLNSDCFMSHCFTAALRMVGITHRMTWPPPSCKLCVLPVPFNTRTLLFNHKTACRVWLIPMGALFPMPWSSLPLTYPEHVTIIQLNMYYFYITNTCLFTAN